MKKIEFYRTGDEYGWMSNFYRAKIVDEYGQSWISTEHYYQAQKSLDYQIQDKIRNAPTSGEAASIGRACELRSDWESVKFDAMMNAVLMKFKQHPILASKLIATEDAILIEKTSGTPRPDPVWGDGVAGEGQNYLGKTLMAVRSILVGLNKIKELDV